MADQNVVNLAQYLSSTSVIGAVMAAPVTLAIEATVDSAPKAQQALEQLQVTASLGLKILERAPSEDAALQALGKLFQAAAVLLGAA